MNEIGLSVNCQEFIEPEGEYALLCDNFKPS